MIDKTRASDSVGIVRYVTVVERGDDDGRDVPDCRSAEADPTRGRISNESPVGRAAPGKRVGEEVQVKIPRRIATFGRSPKSAKEG